MAGAKKTDDKKETLTPGEQHLVKALKAEEPCLFDESTSHNNRTIRGDVLSRILRGAPPLPKKRTVPLPRQVEINGAYIEGRLDIQDVDCSSALRFIACTFAAAPRFHRANLPLLAFTDSALPGAELDDACIRSHLLMNGGFVSSTLSLCGTQIGGQFAAEDATFRTENSIAIHAQGARIDDGVYLDGAICTGEVWFNSAQIGGQFSAEDATFTAENGMAIHAQGARIDGGVFLRGAACTGEIGFNSAQIGGQFSANGATFTAENGRAIDAQGARIGGGVFLRGAACTGEVGFGSAQIGGHFTAIGASFAHPDSARPALDFEKAHIAGGLFLRGLKHTPLGTIDLVAASIDILLTDETSYPVGGFDLRGCTYNQIEFQGALKNKPVRCQGLLEPPPDFENSAPYQNALPRWEEIRAARKDGTLPKSPVLRTPEFSPQPWRQLAQVLDRHGHHDAAKRVLIRMENLRTRRAVKNRPIWKGKPLLWAWRQFYRFVSGYGHTPARAVYWLLLLWAVGGGIFWLFDFFGHMTPAKERFYLSESFADIMSGAAQWPDGYPRFKSLFYSLDVMLPFVDFGQETHWRPKTSTHFINAPLWYVRFHLIMGWALSTIALLGFTGIVKNRIDT